MDTDRMMIEIALLVSHAELKLHISAAKQCIRDNDYMMYMYNKKEIRIYLNEIAENKAELLKAMFNAN